KFIFYRGVGNFATPLRVTMQSTKTVTGNSLSKTISCGAPAPAQMLTIVNTGQQPISSLFLLGVEKGVGKFSRIASLAPGEQRTIAIQGVSAALETVSTQLGEQMVEALVSEGLYKREAKA